MLDSLDESQGSILSEKISSKFCSNGSISALILIEGDRLGGVEDNFTRPYLRVEGMSIKSQIAASERDDSNGEAIDVFHRIVRTTTADLYLRICG